MNMIFITENEQGQAEAILEGSTNDLAAMLAAIAMQSPKMRDAIYRATVCIENAGRVGIEHFEERKTVNLSKPESHAMQTTQL